MGRGFFAGTMWGALVGLVAVALASQLTERRELSFPEPQTAEVEVPGGSEFDQARPETEPVVPAAEAPPTQAEPVDVAAPEVTIETTPVADTSPAGSPVASEEVPAAVETPSPSEPPKVDVAVSEPARTGDLTPKAPAAAEGPADTPVIPSADSELPVPPAEVTQPVAPDSEAASGVARAEGEPSRPAEDVSALASGALPSDAPDVEIQSAEAPPAPEASGVPSAPAADTAGNVGERLAAALPDVTSDSPPENAPADTPAAPAMATDTPDVPEPALPADEAALAESGLPQVGFSGASGVKVNRLPSIGDGETEPPTAESVPEEEIDPDAPALVRYAVPFENPDLAPVISIVLLHDRATMPGPDTGMELPVAVSFAIDAGLPNAADISAAYRRAGREVVLVPTLPPGAAPSDVEVALEVNFNAIPEAVALMDVPDNGFQSERAAVAQVVDAISVTGHGLVTYPRGLNTAKQLADRAGVPSQLVFRQFEAGNADAVLRTLDQAAFRARQEGVVILVGEAEPATVNAVRSWVEGNEDALVAFAPISAALSAP